MRAAVFNIHDVALLLTVGACLLYGALRLRVPRGASRARQLLGLFLLLNALMALHTLLFWSTPIRYPVFHHLPYLYLILASASFLLGPLLYWQHLALFAPARGLHEHAWPHGLPALLVLVFLYLTCFRFPADVRVSLFLHFELYHQYHGAYAYITALDKLLPIGYALLCLRLLYQQPRAESAAAASVCREQRLLTWGFLGVWLWRGITHIFGSLYPGDASDLMGIAGNYLVLGLVIMLALRGLRAGDAANTEPVKDSAGDTAVDKALAARVRKAMNDDKAYLNPQLTLERFAESVGASARDVSSVINRHFGQHFQAFVSHYRLEEAKDYLRDPAYDGWPIKAIARAAGFNSRATFHRFFSRVESVTPGQYRQQRPCYPTQAGTVSQNAPPAPSQCLPNAH